MFSNLLGVGKSWVTSLIMQRFQISPQQILSSWPVFSQWDGKRCGQRVLPRRYKPAPAHGWIRAALWTMRPVPRGWTGRLFLPSSAMYTLLCVSAKSSLTHVMKGENILYLVYTSYLGHKINEYASAIFISWHIVLMYYH